MGHLFKDRHTDGREVTPMGQLSYTGGINKYCKIADSFGKLPLQI